MRTVINPQPIRAVRTVLVISKLQPVTFWVMDFLSINQDWVTEKAGLCKDIILDHYLCTLTGSE